MELVKPDQKLTSGINETRLLVQHKPCECKFGFNKSVRYSKSPKTLTKTLDESRFGLIKTRKCRGTI